MRSIRLSSSRRSILRPSADDRDAAVVGARYRLTRRLISASSSTTRICGDASSDDWMPCERRQGLDLFLNVSGSDSDNQGKDELLIGRDKASVNWDAGFYRHLRK